MGKSTLARSVYDSSDVRKSFKVHVWINISPCFEEPDILYSINKHLSSGARAKAESPQEILEALNLTLKHLSSFGSAPSEEGVPGPVE